MTTAARPTFNPAIGGEDQGFYRLTGGTRCVLYDMPLIQTAVLHVYAWHGHTKLRTDGLLNEQAIVRA
jgi:hypothetical protein